ncbi:hypothetical protein Tco_0002721 [Tanacetum coccineum]
MKEKSIDFVTPTKALGEAQEEDISPTILEAAKTLSKVASNVLAGKINWIRARDIGGEQCLVAKEYSNGLVLKKRLILGELRLILVLKSVEMMLEMEEATPRHGDG